MANENQDVNDFDGGFAEKDESNEKIEQREGKQPGGQPHDSGDGSGPSGGESLGGSEEHKGEDTQGTGSQKGTVKPSEPKPEETVEYWRTEAEKYKKRAEDNQASFTKGQQELAAERKRHEELEASSKKPTEEPAEPQFSEEVNQFFNDFPEAKAAIEGYATHLAQKKVKEALGGVDLSKIEEVQQTAFKMSWENAVTRGHYDKDGNYVPGVPDYYEIAAPSNKPYWDWYASKGYGACDPTTAVQRLKEWKGLKEVERVASEAAEEGKKAAARARQVQDVASAGIASSRRPSDDAGAKDKNDFEGGFND